MARSQSSGVSKHLLSFLVTFLLVILLPIITIALLNGQARFKNAKADFACPSHYPTVSVSLDSSGQTPISGEVAVRPGQKLTIYVRIRNNDGGACINRNYYFDGAVNGTLGGQVWPAEWRSQQLPPGGAVWSVSPGYEAVYPIDLSIPQTARDGDVGSATVTVWEEYATENKWQASFSVRVFNGAVTGCTRKPPSISVDNTYKKVSRNAGMVYFYVTVRNEDSAGCGMPAKDLVISPLFVPSDFKLLDLPWAHGKINPGSVLSQPFLFNFDKNISPGRRNITILATNLDSGQSSRIDVTADITY